MATKKLETLAAARKYLASKEGEGAVISMAGEVDDFPFVPTGSFLIDAITGIGGLPQGRIVEFYGAESCGKSTVLSSCAAQCQKVLQRPVLYLDYEHAMDRRYMMAQGVDLSDDWFVYAQPDTLEQGMRIAEAYMENKLVGLVVFDSIAAMLTEAEVAGEFGNTSAGGVAVQARVMSVSLKKLVPLAATSGTCLAFINQMRTGIAATAFERMRGIKKETTPGGTALKFYASMRVKFTKVATVKGKILDPITGGWEDGIVATKVKAEVVKNKMAPPFRKAEFVIRYGMGIDNLMSVVLVAIERGILKKSGSHLTIPVEFTDTGDALKIQGLENLCNYFRRYNVGFEALEADVYATISRDLEAEQAKLYAEVQVDDAVLEEHELEGLRDDADEV